MPNRKLASLAIGVFLIAISACSPVMPEAVLEATPQAQLVLPAADATATPPLQAEVPDPDVQRITPEQAKAAYDEGAAVFVDVRDASAYALGHVPGAVLMDLSEVKARLGELDPNQWIITYCT